ncbi:MAG TPA: MFS transporter [Puia sp.]|nr:MFS transporter [Puia sp.]
MPGSAMTGVLCMIVVTLGEIFSMPFMNSFWITRTSVSNRGQYAGLYTIAWSTAQVLGPSGGSQLVEHFSFRTLWWVAAGICLTSSLGFRWLGRNK